MRKFTLTINERLMCYSAINFGSERGVGIDDNLIVKIDIIKLLKQGADEDDAKESINFRTCDLTQIFELKNKVYNTLVSTLKTHKYNTVEAAIKAKALIEKLEEVSDEKEVIPAADIPPAPPAPNTLVPPAASK